MSKEFLSKLWLVHENLAKSEIEKNTQLRLQSKDKLFSRTYSTKDSMLRSKWQDIIIFADFILARNHKSVRGNKGCQVIASDKSYVDNYPMKSQDEFETA